MKYEDVIDLARAQDVAEHPGPDFMALMNAVGKEPEPSRRWLWLGSAVALAAATVLAFVWLGPGRSLQRNEGASPNQDQAAMRARASTDLRETIERRPPLPPRHDRVRIEAPLPSEAEGDTDGLPDTPAPRQPPSAEELYRRAEAHMRAGKLRRARSLLTRLLRGHPDYPGRGDVVADLARLEERLGRPQRAACYYDQLATRFSAHPLAAEARKARSRLREAHGLDLTTCKKK
jgi:tetratricopeptide (TPR) repeat protein